MEPPLARKLIAEAFATFVLVFIGCGAVMVFCDAPGPNSPLTVGLIFGLVVMAMVYAVGDISGAHLNPAVTWGFWLARRFPGRYVVPYIAAQLVGAIGASLALRLILGDRLALGATLPSIGVQGTFLMEVFLTLILMFVILSVSTGSKEKGLMAGVAIGGTVAFDAIFGGPLTGASMNPARSLAPALVSGHLEFLWIYLFAPMLGALLGVLIFCSMRGFDFCLSGKQSEMTSPNQMREPLRLLFVCVENSNRSQMAEAFARMLGGAAVEAYSAGSRPSGKINPRAIAHMKELGYDLTTHQSIGLHQLPPGPYDAVVTMGCGDACPQIEASLRADWALPDPREMAPPEFREVRDEVRRRVVELLQQLGITCNESAD